MAKTKRFYIEEKSMFLHEIREVGTDKLAGKDNFVAGATEQVENDLNGVVVGLTGSTSSEIK